MNGPFVQTSLHQRIRGDIEERILSGEWPPGHRIPSEHELAERYRCSRMTVNKVLTQLASAGLIARRRKAGSFVIRPHSQSAVLKIQDIAAEISALGLPYRFEVSERRKRRSLSADVERMHLTPGQPILELNCRHFAGPQPFCLEERTINLAAVPEAERESFADVPPGTWLISRVPWTAAEHRIRAVSAGLAAASALSIQEGAACLIIERRTWRGDDPVTYVRLTYPGDAHELIAHFAPSQT